MAPKLSPFLHTGAVATVDGLAIIHLKRDLQIPAILKDHDEDDEGYSEGKVINTRFGSFPHNTMIGLPWGKQVRASKVDTGSRGRRGQVQEKKRKRDESDSTKHQSKNPKLGDLEEEDGNASTPNSVKEDKDTEAVVASSGFIHLLPPTPENWTSSLPHRTQVVYTPDYSYILHRIRARPGTSIIEAGAGSGSFTHASARAIYSGHPEEASEPLKKKRKTGKVWSFEFHEQRHQKLRKELQDHGLEGIVEITHRDVCENGFLVDGKSPMAESVFLDLPAPWLALPHLARSRPSKTEPSDNNNTPDDSLEHKPFISPLNPDTPVHICTFSPCIEQVQRTVSAMRQLGWVDITMVEIAAKRFEIRRERIGIDNGTQRGLQTAPASVDEALQRLIEVEGTFKNFHENGEKVESKKNKGENPNSKEKIIESLVEKKVYKEGKLVHRTEPEVKTHTSYLVFAILPQEWTEEDEKRAMERWPVKEKAPTTNKSGATDGPLSKRQLKKAARQARKDEAALIKNDEGATERAEDHHVNGAGESVAVKVEVPAETAEKDQVDEVMESATS
jgi:tRNA (adenine57-N1/adenine58-N1)-methyltransferase